MFASIFSIWDFIRLSSPSVFKDRIERRSERSEQVNASLLFQRSFEISCMWMSMSRISLFLSLFRFFSLSFLFVLLFSIVIHLDESRLTTSKRSSECYQHSTPLATGTIAFFGQQTTTNSTPLYLNRRRLPTSHSMTSYSALKRKAQRADISSSTSRVRYLSFHHLRSKRSSIWLSSFKSIWNMSLVLLRSRMH